MAEKKPPAPLDVGKFFLACIGVGTSIGLVWFFWPSSPNPYSRPIPRI